MRLKVSLLSPFAPAKLLLLVPEEVQTISALKKHLFSSLSAIQQHAASSKDLRLDIEGFELLSRSEVGIIQSDDVIQVTLKPESSKTAPPRPQVIGKRAASLGTEMSHKRTKRNIRRVASAAPKGHIARIRKSASIGLPISALVPQAAISQDDISSSSSSSSSSVSSSSSSSSSSSESESESSSETATSSSSAASTPDERPTKVADAFPVLHKAKPTIASHVPPGEGKPETKNRNQRRRKARQYQRDAAQQNGMLPNGHAVLAATDASSQEKHLVQPALAQNPTSLTNRNKKKGFLKEMQKIQGTRTTFTDNHTTSGTDVDLSVAEADGPVKQNALPNGTMVHRDGDTSYLKVNGTSTSNTPVSRKTNRQRHWMAPSDMETFPDNVFITYAEFARPRLQNLETEEGMNGHHEDTMIEDAEVEEEEEDIDIDESPVDKIYRRIEDQYGNLEVLTSENLRLLKQGSMVTWKEVELDLTTFSPELKVQVARIVDIETSDPERTSFAHVKLQKVHRPLSEGEQAADVEELFIMMESELSGETGKYRRVPDEIASVMNA